MNSYPFHSHNNYRHWPHSHHDHSHHHHWQKDSKPSRISCKCKNSEITFLIQSKPDINPISQIKELSSSLEDCKCETIF